MEVEATALAGVAILTPTRHRDARGFFSEVFSATAFADAVGWVGEFVQDNHSRSALPGTVRGLHFQLPPQAQGKLVRVARGRVLDVAVDIRRSSPTFGQHLAVELSASNWRQLWLPPGFAHGFCTLEPDSEVLYKVTAPHAPALEHGFAFDDPDVGIAWPVAAPLALLSEKDRTLPRLRDLTHAFD